MINIFYLFPAGKSELKEMANFQKADEGFFRFDSKKRIRNCQKLLSADWQ